MQLANNIGIVLLSCHDIIIIRECVNVFVMARFKKSRLIRISTVLPRIPARLLFIPNDIVETRMTARLIINLQSLDTGHIVPPANLSNNQAW